MPPATANAAADAAAASSYAAAAYAAVAAYADGADADAYATAAESIWEWVRADLERSAEAPTHTLPALWQGLQEPEEFRMMWEKEKLVMEADTTADWSFWTLWYERVRAGRDIHADKLAEILNPLREDDWEKGPAHVNPLFDDLLALYREEDAARTGSDADAAGLRASRQIRAVRAQVSALKEYVEAEFEFVRGQNQSEPGTEDEVEALVEILRQLRDLVEEMLGTIDDESDAGTALVAVENSLPAVVEKADALAEIETEPQVSEVVLGMAASIKVLTESGTPGSLATGIAALDMVRQTATDWLKRDRSKE